MVTVCRWWVVGSKYQVVAGLVGSDRIHITNIRASPCNKRHLSVIPHGNMFFLAFSSTEALEVHPPAWAPVVRPQCRCCHLWRRGQQQSGNNAIVTDSGGVGPCGATTMAAQGPLQYTTLMRYPHMACFIWALWLFQVNWTGDA